jgi:hypothetical protein
MTGFGKVQMKNPEQLPAGVFRTHLYFFYRIPFGGIASGLTTACQETSYFG